MLGITDQSNKLNHRYKNLITVLRLRTLKCVVNVVLVAEKGYVETQRSREAQS